MRAEILVDPLMFKHGRRMIQALIEAAPIPIRVSETYRGECDLLVTYGTGHPVRRPWWQLHRASGRHCIGWDLGYWNSKAGTMRATIDADHPQAWLRPEEPTRWDAQRIALRNDFRPRGHALIVGIGEKSLPVHGLRPLEWERAAVRRAQTMGLRPLFKPKRKDYPTISGVPVARGSIEAALLGAALVLCRHSNVAVDACIAGIPVICEDGAALKLYENNRAPTPDQRLEFLRSLAHWQYTPDEAGFAWRYLLDRLQ